MERHETPLKIAKLLAKWAPANVSSLLEPAVGNGALLVPLLPLLRRCGCRVVCVDIDGVALSRFELNLGQRLGDQIRTVNGDFIHLSQEAILPAGESGFECIVMNPPFSGRMKMSVTDSHSGSVRYVPLEVAFVLRALQLLRQGGVILAILPSSVVSSLQGRWIRELLLSMGHVRYVHELPRNTFASVEAKAFLVVFEKRRKGRNILLCNHSLEAPERMFLGADLLGAEKRFDYSHQKARLSFMNLSEKMPDVHWRRLGELAEVVRGRAESPSGAERAIHTTDFREGFWNTSRLVGKQLPDEHSRAATAGDLLIMRVGRHCHRSIGPILGEGPFDLTDCVLRIRPFFNIDSKRLLFCLRCVLSWDMGRDLLQRGNAASYIIPEDLRVFSFPLGLPEMFGAIFDRYCRALETRDSLEMERLEASVQKRLMLRVA